MGQCGVVRGRAAEADGDLERTVGDDPVPSADPREGVRGGGGVPLPGLQLLDRRRVGPVPAHHERQQDDWAGQEGRQEQEGAGSKLEQHLPPSGGEQDGPVEERVDATRSA